MKKKKRRLRFSGIILLLLFIYLLIMLGYYIITMPVKNILVIGNNNVSEKEILEKANIDITSSIIRLNTKNIEKRIESISLVNNVIIKKSIFGTLNITIEENKVLFYNSLKEKYVLSNYEEVDDISFVGIPTLVNKVPEENYKLLIKGFSNVDSDIISMISEIEYSPEEYSGIISNSNRYLFRMNDKNRIYITTNNLELMNKYQEIYSGLSKTGTLYLDNSSENSKNYIFNPD